MLNLKNGKCDQTINLHLEMEVGIINQLKIITQMGRYAEKHLDSFLRNVYP